MDLIDTILFDWDGTLIDTAQAAYEAFRKAFCDLGIPVAFERYESIYSPNWYSMYQALRLPSDKWPEADDLWLRHYGRETPVLVQGGQYVLSGLLHRGYCLGIVTSGSHQRVAREIDALGLAKAFRVVVCNEDVRNKKPHPEGLETAMRGLGKRPEVCCYVGDSPDDMEMGRRAQVRSLGVLSRYPSSKKLLIACPDFCFESIIHLLGLFEALPALKASRNCTDWHEFNW